MKFGFAFRGFSQLSKKYLKFDSEGKALIYSNKWSNVTFNMIFGVVFASNIANYFFIKMELNERYFGNLSIVSASIFAMIGIYVNGFYLIHSQRNIRRIKILSSLKSVEIEFFPGFGRAKKEIVDIPDLSNPKLSYFSAHQLDSHKFGNLWLMTDSNEKDIYPGMREYVFNIISGNYPPVSTIEKKANKFK